MNNLLTDGDMNAATTAAWTAQNSATLSKQEGDGVNGRYLRIYHATSWGGALSGPLLTVGRRYAIVGWVRGLNPLVGSNTTTYWSYTGTYASWTRFGTTFFADAQGIRFVLNSVGGTVEFDECFLIDVTDVNLLADWDMELAGIASWVQFNSPTLTKETVLPHGGSQWLKVARGGSNQYPIAAQLGITPERYYRARGWAHGDGGSARAYLFIGTGSAASVVSTTSTAWQAFDLRVLSGTTSSYVYLCGYSPIAGGYAGFDDVWVSTNLMVDGDMELSGVATWLSFSGAILTKDTTSPHSGTQALRLTAGTAGTGGCYILNSGWAGNAYVPYGVFILSGWARGNGTSVPAISQVYAGGGSYTVWTGTSSTTWQPFAVIIDTEQISAPFYLRHSVGGVGNWVEFDDLSLDMIGGAGSMLPTIFPRRRVSWKL